MTRILLILAGLLPVAALAQSAPVDAPQLPDYAAGLAAMADEAHGREIHLQAQLAAARARLAASARRIAELEAKQAPAAAAAPAPDQPAATTGAR